MIHPFSSGIEVSLSLSNFDMNSLDRIAPEESISLTSLPSFARDVSLIRDPWTARINRFAQYYGWKIPVSYR